MNELTKLETEKRNEKTFQIDNMSTREMLETINREDLIVAQKVQEIIPEIEKVVDLVYEAFLENGRLFYVGAGTSGRVGVIDAVECPPTFSTPYEMVQAVIAGGDSAFVKAVEGAEDDEDLGAKDLQERKLTEKDVVIGIAASGRTPYVIGALKYANKIGAKTVSLSSNANALIDDYSDFQLNVLTGPEVLTGSTRMKAATGHKLVLNMITTSSMIKFGKAYENLMVDVKVSNLKLKERAKRIIMLITDVSYETATAKLEEANNEVKVAIVMIEADVSYEKAKELIKESNGFVRKAIESYKS